MIKLLKGEADTLFALRELKGQWIDGKSLSLRMYPDKQSREYFQRARNRLMALEAAGLVQCRRRRAHDAKLYTVTDAGMWTPIDVQVHRLDKHKAANLMRSKSLAEYHESRRKAFERHATEQALDEWLEQKPARIIVPAEAAPRVSPAALRGASVFAWAGQ